MTSCTTNATFWSSLLIVFKISKNSTVALRVPSEEKELRIGAVSSRISSFVITDLLYYGVFKKNFDKNKDNLIDSRNNVSILKK